jgi:erythromycin esterase-like protein
MPSPAEHDLVRLVEREARPLRGGPEDYDALLDLVGEARFVLLGEATHGTHQFYRERDRISERLIREKGFRAVAIEADWPDAYRVNRFLRGLPGDQEATDALSGFRRFPAWMWRNADFLDFVGWLKGYNESASEPVGLYGLDLYSLFSSIEAVLAYLRKVDPEAVPRARYRYSCFDHFDEDPQAYGHAARFGLSASCEDEVVEQLVELRSRMAEYAARDGRVASDEFFYAEQNARLIRNAEEYYRSMLQGPVVSWNLRDRHMAETLAALQRHLGEDAKIVVWAHNSHLGDARATEMSTRGELNLGQLLRERHGAAVVNVGFTTYGGTVTAASDWDAPAERKTVRPALEGSYEVLFHQVALSDFMLLPREGRLDALRSPRLERAIGVVYSPSTERMSHYFHASLVDQFDAVIHLDQTRAVEPLERLSQPSVELPETFPSGV